LTAQFSDVFARTYNAETVFGVGDDCAEFITSAKSSAATNLISVDTLVENVHFRLEWSTAEDVARRAVYQNLADIAASGGRCTGIVVSVVVPKHIDHDWITRFSRTLAEVAEKEKVAVLGGDLSKGAQLVVTITVLGTTDGAVCTAVRRDGAVPGDIVAVAGELGCSFLGYKLFSGADVQGKTAAETARAKRIFLAPEPPLSAGVAAREAGATAMMDVSDGLLTDCGRIANASGVTIMLHANPDLKTDLDFELYYIGGEDHALLATFPKHAKLPDEFQIIGEVVEKRDAAVVGEDLARVDGLQKWDHFNV
jgi:thiamine-monophosphate kinase